MGRGQLILLCKEQSGRSNDKESKKTYIGSCYYNICTKDVVQIWEGLLEVPADESEQYRDIRVALRMYFALIRGLSILGCDEIKHLAAGHALQNKFAGSRCAAPFRAGRTPSSQVVCCRQD